MNERRSNPPDPSVQERLQVASALKDLSPEFLERYNQAAPRYTSYPTAPEWKPAVTQEDFRERIRRDAAAGPDTPLSLYFHIPFCEHRCRFCACNVVITTKRSVISDYPRQLDREMALVHGDMAENGGQNRPVTQLHLGGGTPTSMTPDEFRWFMDRVRQHFVFAEDAEVSLEADPCVTTEEHIATLRDIGYNRISYGVQDINEPTQEIIERVQPVELTERLTKSARDHGFESINMDLVYGLPYQTYDTFQKTLDQVLEWRPDRIALYNFAYLPGKLRHQKVLTEDLLPSGPEKFRIFISAYERFVAEGYEYIGMDHFAAPGNELSEARRNGTLQRNFMGYTTKAGTDLYSFGISSISATDDLYVQNLKKLNRYADILAGGKIPVERGFILSDDDRLRKETIYQLMCQGVIDKRDIERRFGIDFDTYFTWELERLPQFEQDNLLVLHPDRIEVTLLGFIFVRNIATVFDVYFRAPKEQPTYSRTL